MSAQDYTIDTVALAIHNTDTSDESDINAVSTAVNNSLVKITADMLTNSGAIGNITDAEDNAIISKSYAVGLDLAGGPNEPAEGSADTHREAAETARDAADTSATNALASKNKAEDWASEDEDVIVEDTRYSSLHYAAKSAESAAASALNSNQINQNLLINPNFVVNQRNYIDGTYVYPDGYGYDMWKNAEGVNSIKITVKADTSIEFTGSIGAGVEQKNDDILALPNGTELTLSGEVISGTLAPDGLGYDGGYHTAGAFSHTFNLDKSDGIGWFNIRRVTTDVTFKNLKLEVSSFETKYEVPLITEEEMKCYRYYKVMTGSHYSMVGVVIGGDSIRVTMNATVEMSSSPALTIDSSGWIYASSLAFHPTGTPVVTGYQRGFITVESDTVFNTLTVNDIAVIRADITLDASHY